MKSAMFQSQNGTCSSCHYSDIKTGAMKRWDDVKYNVMHGISDVDAAEAKAEISYDQTTITPAGEGRAGRVAGGRQRHRSDHL